jgi:hypothetical protein
MCFALMFSALFVFYVWWFEKGLDARLAKKCAVMACVFGVLILPFAYPLIEKSLSGAYASSALGWSVSYSADVFSFFTPSSMHPVFGRYTAGIYERFTGSIGESTLFVGFSVLAMFAYYLKNQTPTLQWLLERAGEARRVLSSSISRFKLCVVVFALLFTYFVFFGARLEYYLILSAELSAILLLYYAAKAGKLDFWTLSAAVFFLLSLGPLLHIYGTVYPFPLPYLVFPFLPVASSLRDPARLGVLVMLSLSVISAYSLKGLSKNIKKKNLFFAAVSLVVLFEFLSAPIVLTELKTPGFYSELAKDERDIAVLDVPIPRTSALYYQTLHEKRVVSGYISMLPADVRVFEQNTPAVQAFLFPVLLSGYTRTHMSVINGAYFRPGPGYDGVLGRFFSEKNASAFILDGPLYRISDSPDGAALMQLPQDHPQGDIIEQNISLIGRGVLWHYNIAYIIVHEDLLGEAERKAVGVLLDQVLGNATPVYSGEGIVAYAVPETDLVSFASVGGNWHSKEPLEGVATRWMSNNATVKLVSTENSVGGISFDVRSIRGDRRLLVFLNGEQIGDYQVASDYSRLEASGLRLMAGENTVSFYAPEGCVMEANVMRTSDEEDIRCLSLAFRNMSIMWDTGGGGGG